MTTMPTTPESNDDDLSPLLSEPFARAWATPAPGLPGKLGERLGERLAQSKKAEAGMVTVLSTVVSIGYVGFLLGPILIGAAATWVGLPVALAIPVVLALFVAASASAMRAPQRPDALHAAHSV